MAESTAARPKSKSKGLDPARADEYRSWLRQMLLIRRFEEKAGEAYSLGKIGGFCHLYIGQEAVAVGSLAALGPDDYITCSYREHGHALARGISARAVMAELFGKAAGCSGGKGGSMHLFDASLGFLGGHAIVGAHIPLATGMAFAAKYRDTSQVAVCYFGEAAVNNGAFHEALNMAAIWKLPVVFVCENNGYGMSTSTERSTAVKNIAERAAAYSMPGVIVNGNIFSEVAEASHRAVARARAGEGPTLIESKTYRHRGHSKSDRNRYRTREEIEDWMSNRDPITLFENELQEFGVIDRDGVEAIREAVAREIAEGIQFAKDSPSPDVRDVENYVYTEPA